MLGTRDGATARSGANGLCAAGRVLAAIVAGWTLAACGAASPSMSHLRSQATQICTIADRRLDAIVAPSTPSAGAAFLRSGLTVLAPELSELRGLQAPGDSATVYQAAITAFSRELSSIRHTVRALGEGLDPGIAMRDLRRRLVPLESTQAGAWQALQVPACVAS